LLKVEVALPVWLRLRSWTFPVKVEVEFAAVTFKMLYSVEVEEVKLAVLLMERMVPGVLEPMPRNPAAVRRIPSVKSPPRRVAKPKSPLSVEVAPFPTAPPWKMEKMEDVVVPVLWVASSVLKAREILVLEVALP